jgi:Dihydroorotase and related cyclic amidohydrolases
MPSLRMRQPKSIVNYSFYFGATNTNADVLPTLDKSRVCGVKLFMGASTGNMLVDRMEVLRKVFANAGMLIAAHCEEQSIISANTTAFKEKYGEDPDIKYHPQIRSAEACAYSSSLGHPAGKRKQCPPAHPAHQHRTRTGFV